MNCRQMEEKISLYCEGLLEGDELWAAEEHLRHCEECRKLAEELSQLLALTAEIPEVPVPEEFDARLSAALAAEGARIRAEQAASAAAPRKRKPWKAACAVAACFIICFAVVSMAQDGGLSLPSNMAIGGAGSPEVSADAAAPEAPSAAPEAAEDMFDMAVSDSAAAPAPPAPAPEPEAPAGDDFMIYNESLDAGAAPFPGVFNGLSTVSDRGYEPKHMAQADAASGQLMDYMVQAMNDGNALAFHYALNPQPATQEVPEAFEVQSSVECLNDVLAVLGSGTVAYERVGGLLTVDGIYYRLYTLEEDIAAPEEGTDMKNGLTDGSERVEEEPANEVQVVVRMTALGLDADFVPVDTEEGTNDDQTTGNH